MSGVCTAVDLHAGTPCVRLSTRAMGTWFECLLVGEDQVQLRAAGEAALARVRTLSHKLSLFEQASITSLINREAFARPVPVDQETFDLLALAHEVGSASGGAFDITVGPLMAAWGFRGHDSEAATIQEAKSRVGMDHVLLDPANRTIRFQRPGIHLDFGAIAKGYALDIAAASLRSHGVTSGILHAGTSSVIALDAPPNAPAWLVGICNDIADDPITVSLRNRALSVSAPHGRVSHTESGSFGHILDPRTGTPTTDVSVAAVIADSAAAADAWSTALMVLASADPQGPILPHHHPWATASPSQAWRIHDPLSEFHTSTAHAG